MSVRVYRWDLDKTYLETDFESVRGLLRSAVETARDKRAVPGATALLRELARERPGWRPRVLLLSGSPTQMRAVLEAKLRMDGVRFDQLILKDSLGNLRRGRLRAVRDQLGYKLPHLLQSRVGLGQAVREVCFGDDAEADALVYSVYADAVAGRISGVELSRILEASGAYPGSVVEALAALKQVGRAEAVERIFIRLDKGVLRRDFAPLGSRVIPVRGWFEAVLVLADAGELGPEAVERIHAQTLLSPAQIVEAARWVLDRGAVDGERLVERVGEVRPVADAVRAALRLGPAIWRPPAPPATVDWVDLAARFKRKA